MFFKAATVKMMGTIQALILIPPSTDGNGGNYGYITRNISWTETQ